MPRLGVLFLRTSVAALAVLLGLFFATGTTLRLEVLSGPHPPEPYSLLADGFLHGRLSLDVEPDARLLALKDPFDPVERGKIPHRPGDPYLHDTVLHQGRHYMMHGPLPVLAFYLPYRALVGRYPSPNLAVLVFSLLAYAATFALMARVKDRYFAGASEAWLLGAGLAMAMGQPSLYLLTRPWFYESCIASAGAFFALALLAYVWALEKPRSNAWPWLLASGLASVAALARPHFILAAGALALVVGLGPGQSAESGVARRARWAALLLPVLAAGLLWASYNAARFGKVTDFGSDRQLAGYRAQGSGFYNPLKGLSHGVRNFQAYAWQPYARSESFPFVAPVIPMEAEGSTYHGEETIGFAALWPAAWCLLLLPWLWPASRELRVSLSASLAAVAAILGVLFSLAGSAYRYFADFGLALFFLMWVTGLLLEERANKPALRALVAGAFALSFTHGALVGLAFNLRGLLGGFLRYTQWIGVALGLSPHP